MHLPRRKRELSCQGFPLKRRMSVLFATSKLSQFIRSFPRNIVLADHHDSVGAIIVIDASE